MPECRICGYRSIHRLIKRDGYTLHGCDSCGVYSLVDPSPKEAEYYSSGQYRKDVPRTERAIQTARSADTKIVSSILKMRGVYPKICVDLCAEDASVKESGMFGGALVDVWGLNDGPPVREDYYDVATCFLSLEHVSDPREIVRLALRCLAAGGLFIVSVPYVGINLDIKPHHTWYYRRQSLLSLLYTNGFTLCVEIRDGQYIYVCGMRQ